MVLSWAHNTPVAIVIRDEEDSQSVVISLESLKEINKFIKEPRTCEECGQVIRTKQK